jgi:hypothetical protein
VLGVGLSIVLDGLRIHPEQFAGHDLGVFPVYREGDFIPYVPF